MFYYIKYQNFDTHILPRSQGSKNFKIMVKSVGKYDLYRTLGEGAYGKVKYGINRETTEAVAIKILDKEKIQKQNMGAQIKKEIQIMKMINHKHIIAVKVHMMVTLRFC